MKNLLFKILRNSERLNSSLYKVILKLLAGYNLEKLSDKKIREFVTWYLNEEYDAQSKNPGAIFHFLEIAAKKFGLDEIDELAIDSKFIKSIPEGAIYHILKCNYHDASLQFIRKMNLLKTYLTSRINNEENLIYLINSEGAVIDYDYAIRKLASANNISTLIGYDGKINETFYRDSLAKRMILTDSYTLEEIKKYFLETSMPPEIIVDSFIMMYEKAKDGKERENIIATFISIINCSQKRIDKGQEIDSKTGDYTAGYDDYMYFMSRKKVPMAMKNAMAKMLLDTRNYRFIYDWFSYEIESDFNFDLIDALMLENVHIVKSFLSFVNDKYLEYALTRLLNRDKEFVSMLINLICGSHYIMTSFGIDKIDRLLEFAYYKYYDIEITKKSAINLIKLGFKGIPKLMWAYDFTEEERQDIYNAYRLKDGDFLTVYGVYLISGDKNYLLNEKDAIAEFEALALKRQEIKKENKRILGKGNN